MMVKRIKKLHAFHNNPTSITIAKTIAVKVLVLKVCRLNAM
jgi:hypothetical protein